MKTDKNSLQALIFTGLFEAIIYIVIWVIRIPLPAMLGRPFIQFWQYFDGSSYSLFGLSQWDDCRNYWFRWF